MRKLLINGIDPSDHRKATKASKINLASNTLEAVAREWFTKYSKTWSPSHNIRLIRRFERDIFPWIGERPIANIIRAFILQPYH